MGASIVLALLALILIFSTANRWRYEATLRDAVRIFATGSGEAREILAEAVRLDPHDPLPHVFLGESLRERGERLIAEAAAVGATGGAAPTRAAELRDQARMALKSAEKEFETATELREHWPNTTSDSVFVGLAAARLALAEVSPAERALQRTEAVKALDHAQDHDDPDVVVTRAAIALTGGDTAACQKELAGVAGRVGMLGRGSAASYYWQTGCVARMLGKPEAGSALEGAAVFCPTPDTGRMLALAIEAACLNPTAATVEDCCGRAERTLASTLKAGAHRYAMAVRDQAVVWNAIGLARLRARNHDAAVNALSSAYRLDPAQTYLVNRVAATVAKAAHAPAGKPPPDPVDHFDRASKLLHGGVTGTPPVADGRYAAQELLVTAAALYHAARKNTDAIAEVELAEKKFGLAPAESHRLQGALNDWLGKRDLALTHYRQAVSLGSKESTRLEARIEKLELKGKH
jgi:tetratricopeptide (TPR) repeat protein